MLEFVETFDRHRVELHQALSLQVASDVNDLVSKMDLLLGRLFSPREPWELIVSSKIRELNTNGNTDWMKDTELIRSLAMATGDPSVKWDAPSDLVEATKLEMQLNQMKEDLHLSIDVLSQRNTELFALKLKLHTEHLERAILHSARFVINSLSGPHDRLEHQVQFFACLPFLIQNILTCILFRISESSGKKWCVPYLARQRRCE